MTLEWEPNCQGKWDYDGPILSVSSRYYSNFTAVSAIILEGRSEVDYKTLREKYFRGRSEADCKAQVEAWAQEQFEYFRKLLEKEME